MGSALSKTVVYLLLLPALLLGLTSCTDEEIGDAVGIIAIGAGVIVICSNDNIDCTTRHYKHRPRRRPHRHCYYDRYGYYRCPRTMNVQSSMDLGGVAAAFEMGGEVSISEMGENNVLASDWAHTFKLSEAGSEAILNALQSARAGNVDGLYALGLTDKDLKRLSKLKMPKESSVIVLSETLGESYESVSNMFKSLIDVSKVEAKKSVFAAQEI